jgi:GNAT superfamily N-acetyltransferase
MCRHSFNQLARDTFGIEFEQWYLAGYWNDRYRCYSYLDGNRVIANVSVNHMDLILEGQHTRALQIGTVMTHPDYQGKGLSKALMQVILEQYEPVYDLIYLFAHSGAVNFYPRFGFKAIPETQFTLDVELGNATPGSIRKMDLSHGDDRRIFDRLMSERRPVSKVFGVEHAEHILAFYTYNILSDAFYYVEDGDVIILYKQEHRTIHLYDIIGKHSVDFDFLARYIPQEETKHIIFYFTPDLLHICPEASSRKREDVLFVKPATVNIGSQFTYPVTAQA